MGHSGGTLSKIESGSEVSRNCPRHSSRTGRHTVNRFCPCGNDPSIAPGAPVFLCDRGSPARRHGSSVDGGTNQWLCNGNPHAAAACVNAGDCASIVLGKTRITPSISLITPPAPARARSGNEVLGSGKSVMPWRRMHSATFSICASACAEGASPSRGRVACTSGKPSERLGTGGSGSSRRSRGKRTHPRCSGRGSRLCRGNAYTRRTRVPPPAETQPKAASSPRRRQQCSTKWRCGRSPLPGCWGSLSRQPPPGLSSSRAPPPLLGCWRARPRTPTGRRTPRPEPPSAQPFHVVGPVAFHAPSKRGSERCQSGPGLLASLSKVEAV
jgi:hypothetical protein